MEKKELEFAIRMMVEEANICSRAVERAKERNLPMIEQGYFSRILEIDKTMYYLGYTLEDDGRRADCKDIEAIKYRHYKAIRSCGNEISESTV